MRITAFRVIFSLLRVVSPRHMCVINDTFVDDIL